MQLYGWDAVYTIRAEKVNQLFQENMAGLVSTFDYQLNDKQFNTNVHIYGTFGPWQIIPGGDGKLLHLQLPIENGRLELQGALQQNLDLAGVVAVVEIQLQMLPSTDGSYKELRFNFKQVGSQVGDQTDGAVTPVNVPVPKTLSVLDQQMLLNAIANCLIVNQDEVVFVFAKINLVAPDANSWLAPKESVYHYLATGTDQFLCILSLLVSADISNLATQVDPTLVSGDNDACFAISSNVFLTNVIRPSLPAIYGHGATLSNFVFSGSQIINNGVIDCDGCEVGAIMYYPKITRLTINVQDDALQSNLAGACDITGLPNAYFDWSIGLNNKLVYNAANHSLAFAADPHPSQDHSNHIPWYDYILGGGIGAVVVAILVPIISDTTTDHLTSGSALSMASSPPQTVQWAGMSHFDVREAALSGVFYMRGSLN